MNTFVLEYCDDMGLIVVVIDCQSFVDYIFAIIIVRKFVVILVGKFAMI